MAKEFYTKKLGLILKDDNSYGPGPANRWLTVKLSKDDQTELQLAQENTYPGAKAYRQAMYQARKPPIGFSVKDIQATAKKLKAMGVTFVQEPIKEFYGWDALFDDTCGNIIDLHQEE